MLVDFFWYDHVLAVFLLVILPLIAFLAKRSSENINEEDQAILESISRGNKIDFFYKNGLSLLVVSAIVLTTWNISGRSWAVLGFKNPALNWLVLSSSALIVVVLLYEYLSDLKNLENFKSKLEAISDYVPINNYEYKHFIFLCFAAGLCEEIMYRGFLMRYLEYNMIENEYKTVWIILIPAIAFTLGHSYQELIQIFKIFIISILFGVVYYFSESLLIVVCLHIAIDVISGYITVLGTSRIKSKG